jgi:hypothetical protein
VETTNVEHNFLTEKTKDYLNATVKAKSRTDKFYTDQNFFKKTQEQKLKEASSIYFNIDQGFTSKKLAKQFAEMYDYHEFVHKTLNDKKYLSEKGFNVDHASKLKWVNLIYPEVVDIDYTEYSNEKFIKNELFVKEYKDGLMAVSQTIKGYTLSKLGLGSKTEQLFVNPIFTIEDEHFLNFGNIDWTKEKFNNLILYVVAPKINKRKAVKIVLKDNKRWNSIIESYKKNNEHKFSDLEPSQLFFLRKKVTSINALRYLKHKKLANNLFEEHQGDSKKSFLLKTGFEKVLLSNYFSFLTEVDISNYNKTVLENTYSFEDLKEMYLKEVFPYEHRLGSHFIPNSKEEKLNKSFYKSKMIKSIVLHKFCSFDTLPNGNKIDLENKSDGDCFFFWPNINLFELFFNLFNKYNTKISFALNGPTNDTEIATDEFNAFARLVPYWTAAYENDNSLYDELKNISETEFNFKHKHILQEAMDSETGYLMPYDGAFELLDDPMYKFIRFREHEDLISIVISDKNERCMVEVFDKNKVDFKYMIWSEMKTHIDVSNQCLEDIYLKLATCIRDAKVLIERNSTMQFRGKRTPHGCNTKSTYEIYFPRVRYRRNSSKEQLRKERDFFNESRKFSGTRRQHIRRLVAGHKADKKQLLLAKQMDFYVPEGHTYVKASTWGDNMTKREVRYRNTALNGIFYFDTKEMSEAQKIDRLSSAGFEEYCSKHLQKLGYEIKHRRNYDGGIDIRAVKILDNMEAEDLLVQCKHWNYPVSPGAIRDFKTACDLEESKNNKKFVFMTSSKFSPGAVELADKFGIMLVDGEQFIDKKVKL